MKSLNFLKIGFIVMAVLLPCVFINSCVENNNLVLNNDKITLTVGNTTTITPNTRYKDIVWSSSNESVAKVNESSGKVDALSKGNATITAMLPGGEKATCEVEIEEIAITSVQLNHTNIEIKKNNSSLLTAKVYPEKASADSLEWSSGDDSIASVDNNGIVTGKKKGSTVIRCTAPSGKSANCTVKVKGSKKKTKKNTTTINNYYHNENYNSDDSSIDGSTLYCRASDYATLRSIPSRKGKRLAKVNSRESVVYLGSTEEFYYVVYQGKRGYVLKDYFSVSEYAPLNYGKN